MLTATKIYDTLKEPDDSLTIDHTRYVLKRLRESGRVDGYNQGGNCWMYSKSALERVREFIEQAS